MDPDPVCPERLDQDPVNIRPDPQPCSLLCLAFLVDDTKFSSAEQQHLLLIAYRRHQGFGFYLDPLDRCPNITDQLYKKQRMYMLLLN